MLVDDGLQVHLAMLELGDIHEPQVRGRPSRANLSIGERLHLVERLIMQEPSVHHHVIWHAFTKATIDGMQTQLGDLTMYHGPWLVDVAKMESSLPWIELPDELKDRESIWSITKFPEEDEFVLTRMDLGRQSLSNAPRVAGEIVDAIVDLAKYRSGRRHNWTRLDGHLHAIDGRLVGGSMGFHEARPELDVMPSMDAVVDEIEEISSRAGGPSRFRDSDVRKWSETLKWWREASTGHDAGAVLVGVRVLDSIAPHVQLADWDSYVRRYLLWSNVRGELLGAIKRSVESGIYSSRLARDEQSTAEAKRAIERKIVKHGHKMTYFNYVEAVSQMEEIERLNESHTVAARGLRVLRRRLSDPSQSQAWISLLRDDWVTRAARLARVRDALAHGGPTTEESLSYAAKFVRNLVGNSMYIVFDAVLAGDGILARHDSFREDQTKWRERLRAGLGLAPALFPDLEEFDSEDGDH
ncbi:hypothetical protein [Kribbella sp. NPDC003557]|uniref:hypothetical protein n=1 Tax=Kribbella sp. NPDC003557 TaxID=3154449 RepID=UPI0033ACC2CB